MKLIETPITLFELKKIAQERFGSMTKAVVDIEKQVMVVDAELHADQEQYLLRQGSEQKNLWGINLYPELSIDQWIEFDSMINLRPMHNNNSRGVEDEKTQQRIITIVNQLVQR